MKDIKRIMSLNEIAFLWVIVFAIFYGLGVRLNSIPLVMVGGVLFITYYPWYWSLKRKSKGYPAKSLYNPFNVIELHMNNDAKGSKMVFYRLCAEGILLGREKGLDVIFFTWHASEKKLKSRFGNAIEIVKPRKMEAVFNLITPTIKRLKPKKMTNPFVKCLIRTDQLSSEALHELQEIADRKTRASL